MAMNIDTAKIKEWLYEVNSLFSQLEHEELYEQMNHLVMDVNDQICQDEITDDLKEQYKHLASKLYFSILAYVESAGLPEHHQKCKSELEPFLKDDNSLLESGYHAPTGDLYSKFVEKCWMLLTPFQEFNGENTDEMFKQYGLQYLENILNNTAVIIRALNINPKSEAQVYNAVKIVTSSTFSDSNYTSESFQKIAKCYKPDILIPSLNCAVEYKYAINEQTLIRTIDEILIDVEGYKSNNIYKLFYAVFYVKSGIWSISRFNAVWKEKKFPENWKGIMVTA